MPVDATRRPTMPRELLSLSFKAKLPIQHHRSPRWRAGGMVLQVHVVLRGVDRCFRDLSVPN